MLRSHSIMQYYKLHLFGRQTCSLERLFSFTFSTCKDVGKGGIQTNYKKHIYRTYAVSRWKKFLACILSFPCLGLSSLVPAFISLSWHQLHRLSLLLLFFEPPAPHSLPLPKVGQPQLLQEHISSIEERDRE